MSGDPSSIGIHLLNSPLLWPKDLVSISIVFNLATNKLLSAVLSLWSYATYWPCLKPPPAVEPTCYLAMSWPICFWISFASINYPSN